jgi:hypothetical protein
LALDDGRALKSVSSYRSTGPQRAMKAYQEGISPSGNFLRLSRPERGDNLGHLAR